MTFVLFGWRLSGNNLYRRVLTKRKKSSRPSGSVPSAPPTSPLAETSSGVSLPGTSSSSFFPPLRRAGEAGGVSGCTWCFVWWAFLPPARSRLSERGGGSSRLSSGARGRAPASPSPSGAGEVGTARSL